MIFEKLTVGPLQCNCSILACEKTKEALIIDPGEDAERILALLHQHGLKPKYLVHTHAHFDHVGGTCEVHQKAGGEICLHREDVFLYENVAMQAAMFGLPAPPMCPLTQFIEEGDTLRFGTYTAQVLHTPGHTPGSVSFYVAAENDSHLFTGDTLFQGSIGRTDLWGGDFPAIIKSIKNKLLHFDETALIHPGHGPETTVGFERKRNPFLQ